MAETEREQILRDAVELIVGDRNVDYGDPYDDFSLTADLWHSYLKRTTEKRGSFTIQAHDVAVLMALLKVSRLSWTPTKKDHWVDIAGYIGCGWDCVTRENPPVKKNKEKASYKPYENFGKPKPDNISPLRYKDRYSSDHAPSQY